MRKRYLAFLGTLAAVIAVASVSPAAQGPKAGEGKAATTKTGTPPRTVWGDPDLQGIWRNFSGVPTERTKQYAGREFLTDEEVVAKQRQAEKQAEDDVAGESETTDVVGLPSYNGTWVTSGEPVRVSRRTSAIVDPLNGRFPPWTPEQLKRWEVREALARDRGEGDSWEDRGMSERCLSTVMTGLNYGANVGLNQVKQIVQGPGYVAMVIETINGYDYRIISLGGHPAPGPAIRQWLGDARGHWEGKTLVVEIANFNDKQDGGPIIPSSRNLGTNYAGSGERLRVIERFTPVDPQTLEYRYTIDDPQTYTRPYTVVQELTRDDHYMVLPSQCHEGNDGLAGQLASARADEKGAQENASLFRRERRQRIEDLKAEWASWQNSR